MHLELLRSTLSIKFLAILFFAFLIGRQVRRGNYVFFIILLPLFILKPYNRVFILLDKRNSVLIFCIIVIVYELFQDEIDNFTGKILEYFRSKIRITRSQKPFDNTHRFFHKPVKVMGLIIVLMIVLKIPEYAPIKLYIKSTLGMPLKTVLDKRATLMGDIAKFTNEKIRDNGAILVIPFRSIDFEFYTNHNIFVISSTMFDGDFYNKNTYTSKLQHILENDLKYSIEEVRNSGRGRWWEECWKGVDEDLIRKWNREYGITHVIREKELPLKFPVIYENEHWVVYRL